jgi:2-methylcitrate dehydratase PrpD
MADISAERLFSLVAETATQADGDALAMARVCLLDWLACALAGAREPGVEALVADAEPVVAAYSYHLIGRPERTGLRDAVLINGFAGHAVDYDDGHSVMSGHPGVAIIPALVGLAIRHGVSGERFLRGIVAAYEAAARVGAMMAPDHYGRGFHATGTVGAIGATFGGGWMTGLAGSKAAAGLKASFGTDGKPLHAAWAGLVALTAVEWARNGMTGSAAILEHNQGFGAAASSTFEAERGLAPVDRPHIETTMFKEHAACGVTHPAIRIARNLRVKIGDYEISRIRIRLGAAANDICNQADPETGLALKFSVRGVVAMALLGIETGNPQAYSDETCRDPALRLLIARSEVVLDPDLPIGPTWVEVDRADGQTFAGNDPGTETRDLDTSRSGVVAKFDSIAGPMLAAGAAARLRDEVISGSLADIGALLAMCAVPLSAGPATSARLTIAGAT